MKEINKSHLYFPLFHFSIVNRGKSLHSAMNSLHNFDRSIDKFLAWLSETESSLEGVEADVDRLGTRRDQAALRQLLPRIKVRLKIIFFYFFGKS